MAYVWVAGGMIVVPQVVGAELEKVELRKGVCWMASVVIEKLGGTRMNMMGLTVLVVVRLPRVTRM